MLCIRYSVHIIQYTMYNMQHMLWITYYIEYILRNKNVNIKKNLGLMYFPNVYNNAQFIRPKTGHEAKM